MTVHSNYLTGSRSISQRSGINMWLCILFGVLVSVSCKSKNDSGNYLFEALEKDDTGITFANDLEATPEFNMFKYMYFYNGAGVGAGDFNNDGYVDLFFSSNQGNNELYLNKKGLRFENVTTESLIPQDGGWSTGVSVVDINNDGLLDIYVCRVGNYETLHSKNQFLICTGIENNIPKYEDRAAELNLDFSGFGTQAAFLDYDMDGDLDMYLMNHSLRFNGTFNHREFYENTSDSLAGDYLYRNDGTQFTDVSESAGILKYIIGYGLGIVVADVDLDGYPDLYIGNDFHENDYLYINQRNGTFKEVLRERVMHTSQFSMGVDIADINNDALPEIITMDMLPEDPYTLKRSLGEDTYDLFHFKLKHGYSKQFARNTLQLNRGNGMFSEIARYSGVFATDWSWAALWMDFDNDGWKDLFISNGIPKRLNDMDYVNHISNEEIQEKIRSNKLDEKDIALEGKFPEIKIKNKFYVNKGNAFFEDADQLIKNNVSTFSNGSAYADLDNDGDLDIIVNNINDAAVIYRNNANARNSGVATQLRLRGPTKNVNAVGAKVIVYVGPEKRVYEKSPVRGFQGSMEIPLHVSLGNTSPDSIHLIWPDNTYERITADGIFKTIEHRPGLPTFDYTKLISSTIQTFPVSDITKLTGLEYTHEENPFNEFDREQLIPHMVSREGPALAVGDINGDAREDIFIGSSKGKRSALYIQNENGTFRRLIVPALQNDSTYEDVDAAFSDVNGDTKPDLLVASGGNEYFGNSEYLRSRVYINNGNGSFDRLMNALDMMLTSSCIEPYDFSGDGFPDLFIGGRAVPWEYGQPPRSFLLQNDGKGIFRDVTNNYAPDLANLGLVTNAVWCDGDGDGDKDLLISLEWGGITAFINKKGKFEKRELTRSGWWRFTLPVDADGDGDLDLIAGNLGHNTRLKATPSTPVKLYFEDFDGNGKKEQLLTYHLGGKEIPFANKDELQKQLPGMKKKFFYAGEFASASLKNIFGSDKLRSSLVLQSDYFSNVIMINNGNWNFEVKELPWQAQLTSYRDAAIVNANDDSLPDILMVGNFYHNNIQMGQYDADYGTVLLNKGKGVFEYSTLNGTVLKGETRRIASLRIGSDQTFIVARNNDSCSVIKFNLR